MTEENWQDLLRSASELRAQGRLPEAIQAYQRLLETKPDLPDSWYNFAWLLKQAGQFAPALAAYQRALELGVKSPEEVHLNRAVIFSDWLQRPQEALAELRRALELNPDYVPALLNLGNLHEDLGDRGAAREAYEGALARDPSDTLALARLAGVSHAAELDTELAARLEAAIARPEIAAVDRADLGFALAGLLDAAAKYDEAFAAAAEANRASREAAGPAGAYDRGAVEAMFDRLIATFDRPAPKPPEAAQTSAPIFICGLFRSGSTLVEQILGAHSRVTALGELGLMPEVVRRIPGYPEGMAEADAGAIAAMREFYLSGLPAQPTAERLVTDKRPDNFLRIGLIKTIFPEARIIHTRRDPLDNLLSLYFLHLDPTMAFGQDLDDAAHWYTQYQRLMEHWHGLYGADIIDIDYDELVREPRPVIERLLSGLGLDWEDSVLDFHRSAGPVKTASVWQVREPLHTRSSGRARHYARHLEQVRKALPGQGGAGA